MFHPNEAAVLPCAVGPLPGTAHIQQVLMDVFPRARDSGIFNCRTVRGGTALSKHAKGRAGDTSFAMINGKANPQGYNLVAVLLENAWELGLETIIWDKQLWSARWPFGREYTPPIGGSTHEDHVHWEQITPYAYSLTLDQAEIIIGGSVLTPEQEALIVRALPILAELLSVDQELKNLKPPSNFSSIVGATKMSRALRKLDDYFEGTEF